MDPSRRRAFTIAGTPPSWEQQLAAGLLDLGPEAVVSHRAAAALHGFDGFSPKPIEYTVPTGDRRRGDPRGGCTRAARSTGSTAARSACSVARRPLGPSSTWLATASPAELERAIDSAIRDGSSSPALPPPSPVGRSAARDEPAFGSLDELLVDAGGHSDLERAFLRLVREAGLPTTDLPADLPPRRPNDRPRGLQLRAAARSIAEVSGRRGHSSDAERAKDGRRRNELQHARAHRARLHRRSGAPTTRPTSFAPSAATSPDDRSWPPSPHRCGQIGHERGGGSGRASGRAAGGGSAVSARGGLRGGFYRQAVDQVVHGVTAVALDPAEGHLVLP